MKFSIFQLIHSTVSHSRGLDSGVQTTRPSLLVLTLSFSLVLGASFAEEPINEELFRTYGLEANKDSLEPYLQSLLPNSPELTRISQEFAALSAGTYAERLAAYTTLRNRPFVPRAMILQAGRHPDPEVRRWSERLRAETGDRNRFVLGAVLETILDPDKPVLGLTDELLYLNANLPAPTFLYEARQALLSTVQSNDIETLLADFELRPAIYHLSPLDKLLGKACIPFLRPLLRANAEDTELIIEAARLMLKNGDREPLAILANMKGDTGTIQAGAAALLSQASGKEFTDAAGWQAWVEQEGATAKLVVVPGLQLSLMAFLGRWDNVDRDTPSITRSEISRKPNGKLAIKMFGRCHPNECVWGEEIATIVNPTTLTVTWNPGFKTETQTITLKPNGTLEVKGESLYNDARGRRVSENVLGKGLEKDWSDKP